MLSVKLKEIRESKNLSQEQVAKSIGIAKNTYLKYEKGDQSPQLTTLEKIAELYGIQICELIGDKKPTLNKQIESKLALIEKLEEEEKRSLMIVLEGLLLRHQNKFIQEQFHEEDKH